jgi:hypothetical protein
MKVVAYLSERETSPNDADGSQKRVAHRVAGTKRDTFQKIYRHFRQFRLPLAAKIFNGYGISSQLPSRVRQRLCSASN